MTNYFDQIFSARFFIQYDASFSKARKIRFCSAFRQWVLPPRWPAELLSPILRLPSRGVQFIVARYFNPDRKSQGKPRPARDCWPWLAGLRARHASGAFELRAEQPDEPVPDRHIPVLRTVRPWGSILTRTRFETHSPGLKRVL